MCAINQHGHHHPRETMVPLDSVGMEVATAIRQRPPDPVKYFHSKHLARLGGQVQFGRE